MNILIQDSVTNAIILLVQYTLDGNTNENIYCNLSEGESGIIKFNKNTEEALMAKITARNGKSYMEQEPIMTIDAIWIY